MWMSMLWAGMLVKFYQVWDKRHASRLILKFMIKPNRRAHTDYKNHNTINFIHLLHILFTQPFKQHNSTQ